MTEMSASRSAAGVTVFDGRIFVSGGHDGLQIFNTVSNDYYSDLGFDVRYFHAFCSSCPVGGELQPPH